MPVPTAVPPCARYKISFNAYSIRSILFFTCTWYPENSCPRESGVAS